jgi:hypothetical protein
MKRRLLLIAVLAVAARSVEAQPWMPASASEAWFDSNRAISLVASLVPGLPAAGDSHRNAPDLRPSLCTLPPLFGSTADFGAAGSRGSREPLGDSGMTIGGTNVVWSVQSLGTASLSHLANTGQLWPGQARGYVWFGKSPRGNIDWTGMVVEQLRIDALMHLKRLTEPKTQRALFEGIDHPIDGYLHAVEGYFVEPAHWEDGDSFVTNNINHPLMGSMYSHVYVKHDKRCADVGFGDRGYWSCMKRAAVYSALASVNWEWNPLMSETSVGLVGTARTCGRSKCAREGGWTDFVMTPLGGMGFSILGDYARTKLWPVLDRHLSDNKAERILKNVLKVATDPGHSLHSALSLDLQGVLRPVKVAR